MPRFLTRRPLFAAVVATVAAMPGLAGAQVDSLETVVAQEQATGGVSDPAPIGAFGYDPIHDRVLVGTYSSGIQVLRSVNNVSAGPGGQSVENLVHATAWMMFTRDGNPDRGGGLAIPGGILFNPQEMTIGGETFAPYTRAFIADGSPLVRDGTTPRPDLTQRLYLYDLTADDNGDARDEFTSLLTMADFHAASGSTGTSSSFTRQFAFSSDGQSIYGIDTGGSFPGLYKVNVDGSGFQQVYAEPAGDNMNTEPAVVNRDGRDLVLFRGLEATGNVGGIDAYDTASDSVVPFVASAQLQAFFDLESPADLSIASMTSDADGNLYFNNTDSSPERRGIFKLDTEGRLIKVVGYDERRAVFGPDTSSGNPNSNTLRMQAREATFTGDAGSFELTQILYAETSGVDAIAGAWVFEPGDFDRDNDADTADVDLFLPKLTERGVAYAGAQDARYDLNASGSIDWRDVKVLQQFLGFADGDSNLDMAVDFLDLDNVELAYLNESVPSIWTVGEFTGDDVVNYDDLLVLAGSFDFTPTLDEIETRYAAGVFREDVIRAFNIPEPGSAMLLGLTALAALRRRR